MANHGDISVQEHDPRGAYLVLHGGGGPRTVAAFGALLADRRQARVLVPTHPGFAGTPRPDALDSVAALARAYVALLERLDLRGVTVIGNSIGGWIAAEMALAGGGRIRRAVLVDAAGFVVDGEPPANVSTFSPQELAAHSFHDPVKFAPQPGGPKPDLTALVAYAGRTMSDPTLLGRVRAIDLPVHVVWGASDRIVTPAYGRAVAAAIPGATFAVLPESGHLPQLETPERLLAEI
ncbi:MAG TPA: alpha/beta hydrolase [Kofleriaceae bacterium]|jgi:pimeloyl-ACP methyl ester carboxylesterase